MLCGEKCYRPNRELFKQGKIAGLVNIRFSAWKLHGNQ
jgi:hypothetical protein